MKIISKSTMYQIDSEIKLKQRLMKLVDTLQQGFIERDTAIRLALLALISGEHLLLIGEPGTAKSELARRLHLALSSGTYFERLLTKFSVPEELFGPLSIKALEKDRYHRLTKNYLPSATIAFIDEIFKANSAILNTLLTLLNEREFDNGDQRVKVPLLCVVGASNELPQDNELNALYDRFLFRYEVRAVSEAFFTSLLTLSDDDRHISQDISTLELPELQAISEQACSVSIPQDVLNLFQALRSYLQQNKIQVSDRRWRKSIKMLQVAAFTNAKQKISIWDCYLLQFCLWEKPEQQELIARWYHSHLGIGSGFNQERMRKLVDTWALTLKEEQSHKTQVKNSAGKLLYLDQSGQQTTHKQQQHPLTREGEKLYLAPPDNDDRTNADRGYTLAELKQHFFDDYYQQCHINGHWEHIDHYVSKPDNFFVQTVSNKPLLEATLYSPEFIFKRMAESNELLTDMESLVTALEQQLNELSRALAEHLWITSEFIDQARHSLQASVQTARELSHRMENIIAGFKLLPVK